MRTQLAVAIATGLSLSCPVMAEVDIAGRTGGDVRYFLQDPAYPQQQRTQISVFAEPEFYTEWNDGNDSLLFRPFARYDNTDSERTHGDIRELQWLHVADNWETRVGIGKVFWGQTESVHLVDIINQTDTVEAVDGEDKLGQPMVNVRFFGDWGTFSAYVLPYFRERTFNGAEGRLRPPLPIEASDAVYESDQEERHIDYALRWQRSLGQWEVGLSFFDGTTREPELIAPDLTSPNPQILPYYAQIQQYGLDVLNVSGSWLWKLEAIYRQGQSQDFAAAVAGFEYTTVGILDTQYDLGVLMEYQFDEREDNYFAIAQNDLMVGLRFILNDIDGTEVLAGFVQDFDNTDTYTAFVEASSRITDNWRWSLDAYFFSSDTQDDTYYFIRRDDNLQFTLEYFF
ncbi:hypothetical protein [Alteromonas sp. CYL-A6]|uniref:hypothetical protein n=1 Tax=Alteromonas nitratireducens TaxID=3390813 RepID=UPI0034AE35EA